MNCETCDKPMRYDGIQLRPVVFLAYELYTCMSPDCARHEFTFALCERAMTEHEVESQASFYASVGMRA
jgi:hypothetical protein